MAGAVDVVPRTEIEGRQQRQHRSRVVATAQPPSRSAAGWGERVGRWGAVGGGVVCPPPSPLLALVYGQSGDSFSETDIQGSILLNIPELLLHRELPLS